MNLKKLSDEALLSETKSFVALEREMTLAVLHHLREIEARRLFAPLGFSSLFDYAVNELGYCAASAARRIDAMRLLKEIPTIEEKIQNGALSLTTVSKAQSFFKKEDFNLSSKIEILESLEHQSTREVEKTLLSLSVQPEVHLQEKIRPVTKDFSEVKFFANDELLENLEKLKGLLAHSHPGMTTSQLIEYLAQIGLKKLDPAKQESKFTPARWIFTSSATPLTRSRTMYL